MQSEERSQELVGENEVHWLNAAELRSWVAFWGVTNMVNATLDRELRAKSGLSHADYQILVMLSNFPDHQIRMSELADMVFESRSRLTYQITQLEREGLVRREDCPTDKRGAVAVLTSKGQEMLQEIAPSYTMNVRRVFFDRLTEEQITLLGEALQNIFAGFRDKSDLEQMIERELNRGKSEGE